MKFVLKVVPELLITLAIISLFSVIIGGTAAGDAKAPFWPYFFKAFRGVSLFAAIVWLGITGFWIAENRGTWLNNIAERERELLRQKQQAEEEINREMQGSNLGATIDNLRPPQPVKRGYAVTGNRMIS